MPRLHVKTVDNADAVAQPILRNIQDTYGVLPNFYGALGIDGASLAGYLAFEQRIAESGLLSARQRELISLYVANYNACHYCVSGHTYSARRQGLPADECAAAQNGQAVSPEDQALLDLAAEILERRGSIAAATIERFLAAGFSQEALIQVCAWTGLNSFSNWINNIVDPVIDFPKVPLQPAG